MRTGIIFLVIAMAQFASADLAIRFNNNDGPIYLDSTQSTGAGAGQFFSVVWRPTAMTIGGVYESGLAGGEILLGVGYTGDSFGLWGPLPLQIWGNTDVGGADINSGFFLTRVFNTNVPVNVEGVKYVEYAPYAATTTYDQTIENTTIYDDSAAQGQSSNWEDNYTAVTIPEPQTLGLIGISLVALFFARRPARGRKTR